MLNLILQIILTVMLALVSYKIGYDKATMEKLYIKNGYSQCIEQDKILWKKQCKGDTTNEFNTTRN